jgi:two-component sensor histidine kinase
MSNALGRWLKSVVNWNGRPWPRADSALAWAIAAALVLAGFIAKPLLDRAVGEPLPPFITFYASVTISALIGGPRIGLAVTGVTVMLTWMFFMSAQGMFSPRTLVSLVIYLVLSSFLSWIVGKARLVQDSLAESEIQRDRAARESVHRIKNLIAVVQAISSKLAREVNSVAEYRSVLSARLVALGSAQDVLVQSAWSDAELSEIVKSALAPFLPNPGLTVRYGPASKVPARHISGLSMALYELCTNSMKYGALAEGVGPVTLSWYIDDEAVVLEWIEIAPAPPVRDEGLGTQLIRHALGADPAASVRYAVEGPEITAQFRWMLPTGG